MNFADWLHLPWAIGLVLDVLVNLIIDVAVAMLLVVVTFRRLKRYRQKLAAADLDEIDRKGPDHFEEFLRVLFERMGYEVDSTERYDKGADLIISREGLRSAVQAKCWKEPVGVEAVRAVLASLRPYNRSRGMVVTNSTFTRTAREAARENGIELWDRTHLANTLLAMNNPGQPLPVPSLIGWLLDEPRHVSLAASPPHPYESTYVCAACGRQVTPGVRKYCLDQPARFKGKVYCMEHQREWPTPAPTTPDASGEVLPSARFRQ